MTWSFFASLTLQAAAPPPALDLPVACRLPERCVIQKLVDHAPGPERQDARCGTLTTDGHKGTDIRLRRYSDMAGPPVPVLAAAAGRVARVRDGVADADVRQTGPEAVGDRQAGNAVVIEHPGGWETQYSHLRQGSVLVRPGQVVEAGTPVGAVGMSGLAEFPHLHFELRRPGGQAIDPFTGTAADERVACGAPGRPLWRDAAGSRQWVRPNEIVALGFADRADGAEAARRATRPLTLAPDPAALVGWADVAGLVDGTVERLELIGPDGRPVVTRERRLELGSLSWFSFAGRPRPAGGWPAGEYRLRYLLNLNGDTRTAEAAVRIGAPTTP